MRRYFFSGFFRKSRVHIHVQVLWYCAFFAHRALEVKESSNQHTPEAKESFTFFFACVRTCMHMCACGVSVEYVGCVRSNCTQTKIHLLSQPLRNLYDLASWRWSFWESRPHFKRSNFLRPCGFL